ncbi:MAG: BGTF surface domain-containing protein [Halodesulfurarchaeum sp.]|nr:BGTF surface domain-containing protein [Halodesulfurarchaeum sp.]
MTVENNGTLADEYIDSIALETESTTIATTTSPTPNGTWVLEPGADAGWFGPTESTAFSLHPTLTDDAPGGKTVALKIPAANDSDGDGSFDPGETGLFLEQDDPRGGLGPSSTLRVPSKSTGENEEELPSPVALSIDGPDGNVSATDGEVSVSISANASDRDIVVTLQNATDGAAVQSVEANLNSTGDAVVAFDPQPGRYQVHVTALESNSSAVSEPFVIEPPTEPGFLKPPESVERGERSPFEVDLGSARNGSIQLKGPTEQTLETMEVASLKGKPRFELAVDTGGRQAPGPMPGFEFGPGVNTTQSFQWFTTGSNESVPSGAPTKPGTPTDPVNSGEPPSVNATGRTQSQISSAQNGSPAQSGTTVRKQVGPRALGVGEYTLVLSTAGEPRANATFGVRAEWHASFETFVVPRDVSLDTTADVRTHAIRENEIATGDQVVVAVNTSGLGTYTRNISVGGPPPAANASPVARANNTRGRGRDEAKSARSPPAFVSLGPKSKPAGRNASRPTDSRRIDGTEPGQFYVVAEAAGDGIEPGADLETELVLTDNSPFVPPDGDNESVETALDVVEAKAGFDGVSPNGSLDLPPQANTPINGTTTVAPGTTLIVHIEGANDSFEKNASATVDEDGTYEATANLSEYESGTDYTVSVTADGDQLSPTRSGKFVEAASDPAAAGGGGGGSMLGSADDGESSEGTGDRTETEPTVESDELVPDQMPDLPTEAVERAWASVPEPLRMGMPAILLSGLGGLALMTVGRGVFRLLWP